MKKNFFTAILLGLILVLAACSGGNNNSKSESSQTGADDNKASETTSDKNIELIATNWDFDKKEYVVQAGEEVNLTLVNERGNHGIAIEGLDVEIIGNGSTSFTPKEKGEYVIYCNIPCGQGHDDMIATLIVQ